MLLDIRKKYLDIRKKYLDIRKKYHSQSVSLMAVFVKVS